MKFFKKIFNLYVISSVHVAVAVFCLVCITVRTYSLDKHLLFLSCVFFGTVWGYNFLKYFEIVKKGLFRFHNYYSIYVITFLSAIGFSWSFYLLTFATQKLLLIAGFFVLIYPLFRVIGWLKLFFVSFVITFITVYIPFQATKWQPLEFHIALLQRFLILISLLIPFEIMDSKTDSTALNTLPQRFGIEHTKLFGILLVIPFIGLEFLKLQSSYLVIPIGVIVVLLINFTEWKRSKYYTSFWVESVPILWWILHLILLQFYNP